MDFAAYLNAFLSLPRFRGHNLIGMGHSGSCTVWYATLFLPDFPSQCLTMNTNDRRVHALTKFAHMHPRALILLEPTIMFPFMSPTDPRSIHGAANVRGALAKRDTWPSRTELRHWLTRGGKNIWSRWDPRVLDLYVVCPGPTGEMMSLDELSLVRNTRLKRW